MELTDEILNANYNDTLSLLKNNQELESDDVWRKKCQRLYPGRLYFDFYTPEENFLLKHRKKFTLMIDDTEDPIISNMIYEYNKILKYQMKGFNMMCDLDKIIKFVKIDIMKQFIIIKRGEDDMFIILSQCDKEFECNLIIEIDAKKDVYDSDYYIINIKEAVPCFVDVGILSMPRCKSLKYTWIPGNKYK